MSRRRPYVTAAQLAQMGVCERRILLERKHGKRATAEQRSATARGDAAHDSFFAHAQALHPRVQTSLPRRGCFIATAVFGPDVPECAALRRFRDRVLRRHRLGLGFIALYYRVSPPVATALARHPALAGAVRLALVPLARGAAWLTARRGARRG
jgi:hypothetical protein